MWVGILNDFKLHEPEKLSMEPPSDVQPDPDWRLTVRPYEKQAAQYDRWYADNPSSTGENGCESGKPDHPHH